MFANFRGGLCNPKICVMPMNSDLLDELVDSQLLASILVDVNFWTDFVTIKGQLIHQKIQYLEC